MIWACSMRQRGSRTFRSASGTDLKTSSYKSSYETVTAVANRVRLHLNAAAKRLSKAGSQRLGFVGKETGGIGHRILLELGRPRRVSRARPSA
jgi:hypothetical protein